MEREKLKKLGLEIGEVLDRLYEITKKYGIDGVMMMGMDKDGWGSADIRGISAEVKRRQDGEIWLVEESCIKETKL